MRTALFASLVVVGLGCSTSTETVTVPGECADGAGTDSVSLADSAPADDATDATVTDTGVAADTGGASDTGVAAMDSATVEDTGPGCAIKAGGDICSKIPKMTFTGKQIVDGIGDEFCDIPSSLLAVKTGVPIPGSAPSSLPGKLRARIAWSPLGVHAHFHVDDPEVFGLGPLATSDEVRLFISGKAPVFGEFVDRRDKSAFGIMMYPPSPRDLGLPGFGKPNGYAQLFYVGHQKATDPTCQGLIVPLTNPAEYASRIVPGGYEMELFLPWAVLGRTTPPTSGDEIAIDMLLFDSEDPEGETAPYVPADSALLGRVYYKIEPVGTPTTCCGSGAEPSCDDRSWCVSPLE